MVTVFLGDRLGSTATQPPWTVKSWLVDSGQVPVDLICSGSGKSGQGQVLRLRVVFGSD